MSYTITNDCIACQRCLTSCPTTAIETDGANFWINVNRCNQCQDSHGVAQCWAVCPTNEGCVPLATGTTAVNAVSELPTDYWNVWFASYSQMVARLKSSQQPLYWQQWFDIYSQALKRLRNKCQAEIHIPLMP
ncbi:MAG: 4Fe-4S ferredoxin [Cyanobacteria bacterium P01_D01_bin.156]